MTRTAILAAALLVGGCATGYQLTLMPRDSGRIYTGTAEETTSGEGRIAVEIDGKRYSGTWVQSVPDRTHGYVAGGFGWGRRGLGSLGTSITMDNPQGGEVKALLTEPGGSGLRCDLRSAGAYGGGVCRDDRGKEYDVQLRPASREPGR